VKLNPERFRKSLIAYAIIKIRDCRDQDEAGNSLSEIEDIQEVHYISGEDSFLIKIRAMDTVNLSEILNTKILAIESIKSSKTLISLKSYKETSRFPLDISLITTR